MKKKAYFYWNTTLLGIVVLSGELIVTSQRVGDQCIDYTIVTLSLVSIYDALRKIRKKPSG